MIQNVINVNTMNEASANEIELIEIYEGNQNKTEYTVNEESISLDSYILDDSAVVGDVCWKPVVGFEEYYEVTDYGAVRSLHSGKKRYHKLLKPKNSSYSYHEYNLKSCEKNKCICSHRLVAQAFIPNPNNLPQVDHINGVKIDNRIQNLHWVTNKENINNPITLERWRESYEKLKSTEVYKKSKKRGAKKAAIKVAKHIVCIETGKWFNSSYDVEKEMGCLHSVVKDKCRKYAEGNFSHINFKNGKPVYHFRFATEEENAINLPKYIEYVNELVKML